MAASVLLILSPQMAFGRTLNNALKQKGITAKFGGSDGLCAIAQDRQR
jgi:hypothetical protein